MGQRGYRQRRQRCELVLASGQRCPVQVKRAGCRFCCHAHAVQARTVPRVTAPGAQARAGAARQKVLDALTAVLQAAAFEGHITVQDALSVLPAVLDQRYASGYHAGLIVAQRRVRTLRLTESRTAVHEFLRSRFGKAFMGGELSPDALAKFRFAKR